MGKGQHLNQTRYNTKGGGATPDLDEVLKQEGATSDLVEEELDFI
jgi:hypothetical protein